MVLGIPFFRYVRVIAAPNFYGLGNVSTWAEDQDVMSSFTGDSFRPLLDEIGDNINGLFGDVQGTGDYQVSMVAKQNVNGVRNLMQWKSSLEPHLEVLNWNWRIWNSSVKHRRKSVRVSVSRVHNPNVDGWGCGGV